MALRRMRHVSDEFVVEYVDIHPEELWEPGHIVYDWCVEIGRELKVATRAFTPHDGKNSEARWPRTSTGRLLASVYTIGHRTGPESYNLEFGAGMHYAAWVHGGTAFQRGGYIYSNLGYANRAFIDANVGAWKTGNQEGQRYDLGSGKYGILPIPRGMFLSLPPGGGHSRRYHLRVRGQRANPFLVKAWRTVHFRHEGLPTDLGVTYPPPLEGK
jgi:hypothetical protein